MTQTFIRQLSLLLLFLVAIGHEVEAQSMRVWRDGHLVFSAQEADSVVFGTRTESLPVNVHLYTDLGLSVYWATCNIGATEPHQQGDLFAWGETMAKDRYTADNYLYGVPERQDTLADANGYHYVVLTQSHYTDLGADISGTEYDAAWTQWGGDWRMPTLDEFLELRTQCQWHWETSHGVNGYRIVAANGNSIFLPAVTDYSSSLSDGTKDPSSLSADTAPGGSYWTASANVGDPAMAEDLDFIPSLAILYSQYRYMGMPIRPVLGK